MTPTGGQRKIPHSPAITIPSSVKPYTPSPAGSKRAPRMQTSSAQRRLEDDLVGTMDTPQRPLPSNQTDVTKIKRYDPLSATVYTTEGRALANDQFLNACRLLAHHSIRRQLKVGSDPVLPESLIYVREPCSLYRREILAHLSKYSSTSDFMPPFSSFMEAIL